MVWSNCGGSYSAGQSVLVAGLADSLSRETFNLFFILFSLKSCGMFFQNIQSVGVMEEVETRVSGWEVNMQ